MAVLQEAKAAREAYTGVRLWTREESLAYHEAQQGNSRQKGV
jgi:hypothetical protein